MSSSARERMRIHEAQKSARNAGAGTFQRPSLEFLYRLGYSLSCCQSFPVSCLWVSPFSWQPH